MHSDDRGRLHDRSRRASSSSRVSPHGRYRRPRRGSSRSRRASPRRTSAPATPSRSGPRLLTRMSRSPASSTRRFASVRVGDVGLDDAASGLPGPLPRPRLAPERQPTTTSAPARASSRRDRPADPARTACDEWPSCLRASENRQAVSMVSRNFSSEGGVRAGRRPGSPSRCGRFLFSKPVRTLARPDLDEDLHALPHQAPRAACVNLTVRGQLLDEQRGHPLRGLDLGGDVDMNGAIGSENLARSSAGRSARQRGRRAGCGTRPRRGA